MKKKLENKSGVFITQIHSGISRLEIQYNNNYINFGNICYSSSGEKKVKKKQLLLNFSANGLHCHVCSSNNLEQCSTFSSTDELPTELCPADVTSCFTKIERNYSRNYSI